MSAHPQPQPLIYRFRPLKVRALQWRGDNFPQFQEAFPNQVKLIEGNDLLVRLYERWEVVSLDYWVVQHRPDGSLTTSTDHGFNHIYELADSETFP